MEQNAEPRNRCTQIKLLFDKRAKAIQWNKAFLANGAKITGHPHVKKEPRHKSDTLHKN